MKSLGQFSQKIWLNPRFLNYRNLKKLLHKCFSANLNKEKRRRIPTLPGLNFFVASRLPQPNSCIHTRNLPVKTQPLFSLFQSWSFGSNGEASVCFTWIQQPREFKSKVLFKWLPSFWVWVKDPVFSFRERRQRLCSSSLAGGDGIPWRPDAWPSAPKHFTKSENNVSQKEFWRKSPPPRANILSLKRMRNHPTK